MKKKAAALFLLVGCASTPTLPPPVEPSPPPPTTTTTSSPSSSSWVTASQSPWPLEAKADDALRAACGEGDAALERVARAMLANGDTSADRAVALLRENGEPHVRPRVITAKGDPQKIAAQLAALRKPHTRCGVATVRRTQEQERVERNEVERDGDVASSPRHARRTQEQVLVVTIHALADLDPLPTRARTGEWLTFSASLLSNAKNPKLIVLGPRGAPRTVPTSFQSASSKTRARFALDQPGAFTVQLMGDLDGTGPQPLLEARVFADIAPTTRVDDDPAPGEDATDGTLEAMIAKLRVSESLSALKRDERLDALAVAHLKDMIAKRTIAHDVGDGDLRERFERESLQATSIGENVAKARSLPLAHRALHASPGHRMNLLRPDYTHVGLADGADELGNVYVCEVFATNLR